MTISVKTHKMLWGRSGNRCAFPDCGQPLVEDSADVGPHVVGVEAHIVASSPDGPRGNNELSSEARDSFQNLLLLCPVHHRLVDDHPETYTVERLQTMKADHEAAIAASETPDERSRRLDNELYGAYVDEWVMRADLDGWTAWASRLTSHGQPSLGRDRYEAIHDLRIWLLSRVWPGRYIELESAFLNFRLVLDDLFRVFSMHVDDFEVEVLRTRKFYKIDHWDEDAYHRLLREYERHVDRVENLALELTRAANFVCDRVREVLDPHFRITQGALLIATGPDMHLAWDTYRPEYRDAERTSIPYPGLDKFDEVALTRDFCFSSNG